MNDKFKEKYKQNIDTRKPNQIKVTPGRDPSPVYSVFCIYPNSKIADFDVAVEWTFPTLMHTYISFRVRAHMFATMLTGVPNDFPKNIKPTDESVLIICWTNQLLSLQQKYVKRAMSIMKTIFVWRMQFILLIGNRILL